MSNRSPKTILIGQRFGRLLIVSLSSDKDSSGGFRWECVCDCGSRKVVNATCLRSGNTTSCGCLKREVNRVQRNRLTHGQTGTREHRSWRNMKQRCCDPNHEAYANYGGRGIKVCDRWITSFENFLSDMGPAPSMSHSLDRIDSDGGYCPENCRWATKAVQATNTRTNVFLTLGEETLCIAEWSRKLGLSSAAICYRLRRGWSDEDVLSKPLRVTVRTKKAA